MKTLLKCFEVEQEQVTDRLVRSMGVGHKSNFEAAFRAAFAFMRALECKRKWEEQPGDIYDLFPDDSIN